MALPNLPTSYTTRKNIYEAAIVRRRTKENDFRESWDTAAKYFQREDVNVTKQKYWTSDQSFNESMDAFKTEKEKERKLIALRRRKLKLAELLKEDTDHYRAELAGLSKGNFSRLSEMKERTESLRSAREEKRKTLAEDLMYEHWRQNNTDIRELEAEHHKQHVIDKWAEQEEARRLEIESARKEKEEYEARLEVERLMALEELQKEKVKKAEDEKLAKAFLRKQIEELRDKEAETDALKQEEAMLIKEQNELFEIEQERKKMEEEHKKVEFGRILLRQHAASLRRKSKLVQEELEADLKFLERLASAEERDKEIQTARREKTRADASWMKQVLEDQIKLEKAREAELDMLYQDEAARIWEKRESDWNRERDARLRLMEEVLDGRREQIDIKREELRQQQEESLERREELLREIELGNQMTQREKAADIESRRERKKEIEEQITARRDKKFSEQEDFERELEEERLAQIEYEEMLKKEAEKLNLKGYEPKQYGVRKPKNAWQ